MFCNVRFVRFNYNYLRTILKQISAKITVYYIEHLQIYKTISKLNINLASPGKKQSEQIFFNYNNVAEKYINSVSVN